MRRIAEFKEKNKDLLTGLMPEKVEKIMLNEDIVNVLANRDHKGRRILINKAGKAWDPKKATPDQVFQMFYLIHQGALLEPATQVNGVVVILDFDGLGMAQVLALSPSFSLRLLNFIQVPIINNCNLSLKAFIFFNSVQNFNFRMLCH